MRRLPTAIVAALGAACLATACGSDTAPSPTPAAPSITKTFAGTLAVGGSRFYSFTVSQYGTVNVTLVSLGVADPAITVGLSNGTPSGTGCTAGTALAAGAGTTPQLTSAFDPGVYCTKISDLGNLVAPADFVITIAYP